MPENIVNWGLAKSGYGKITLDANGNDVLGPLITLAGTRQINLTPNGELVQVYADGTVVHIGKANTGYGGTMEVTVADAELKRWALAEEVDANNVQYEISEPPVNRFYLVWEWVGDLKRIRHIMYNLSANRPAIASTTKGDGGNKSPQYDSLPLIAIPRKDGMVKANTRHDVGQAVYDNWFQSPYLPSGVSEYPVTVTVKAGATPIAAALVMLGDGTSGWTGTDGKVVLYKKAGTYHLFVSKSGYAAIADSVTVASAAVNKDVAVAAG